MIFNQKILLLLLVISTNAYTYEPATHQALSERAVERSILGDPSKQLLIDFALIDDIGSSSPIFSTSTGIENQSVVQLIRFGADFEDDIETERSLNHFYDPQNDRPLFAFGETRGIASPDWSLGDVVDITDEQEFSYRHANEYFRNAIVLSNKPERDQNWGLTFQSLGQIIHHIQDMAQPQHVRNDLHCNILICKLDFLIGEDFSNPSIFEEYTEEKRVDPKRGLNYAGYPDIDLNIFNKARLFWDDGDINSVRGMAEFTSNNFLSVGTNFEGGVKSGNNIINIQTHEDYDFPEANIIEITSDSITDIDLLGPPGPNHSLTGDIKFVGTQVTDSYIPAESRINSRTSSFSIFDNDLVDYNVEFTRKFTLNRFNYDAAHEFLIPRAVAYSAGLIDYFFRGRISTEITADGDGIEITNISNEGISDTASPTTFQSGGAFEVYYVTDSEEHKPLLALSNLTLTNSLPINGAHTIAGLNAALAGITDMGGDGRIIILFDGDIGTERGLAVVNTSVYPRVLFFTGGSVGRNGVQIQGFRIKYQQKDEAKIFSNLTGNFYFPAIDLNIPFAGSTVIFDYQDAIEKHFETYVGVTSYFPAGSGREDLPDVYDYVAPFSFHSLNPDRSYILIVDNHMTTIPNRWSNLGILPNMRVIYTNGFLEVE